MLLLLSCWSLYWLDVLLTFFALQDGTNFEVNPLAHWVIVQFGAAPGFILLKAVAGIPFMGILLLMKEEIRRTTLKIVTGIYAIITINNLTWIMISF